MQEHGLDLLCMREAGRQAVNGGFYVIRCSDRMRRFMSELIRRASDNPGALHDQEHLNAMLGLTDGGEECEEDGRPTMQGAAWEAGAVRFEILPDNQYIWAQNWLHKDLSAVCFHHAVATTGIATKVSQIARVRAAVALEASGGRLARRLSPLRTGTLLANGLTSAPVWLRAYAVQHVATVVGWQVEEPELPSLLGLEGADDYEEEVEYVRRVKAGVEPCTIIMVILARPAGTENADDSTPAPQEEASSAPPDEESLAIVGTISARFRLLDSYPCLGPDGCPPSTPAAAVLAESLAASTASAPPLEVEVEVEIARAYRRRGLGAAALELLLGQIAARLPEASVAVARVPASNEGAYSFFMAAGFDEPRECAALNQVELRRAPLSPHSPTARWPAYYINVDAHVHRRMQAEAALRRGGLLPKRIAALTPSDAEVRTAQAACPDKPVGWHANAASHALIWRLIAEGAASRPRGDGPEPATEKWAAEQRGSKYTDVMDHVASMQLSFIFEDDVVLHTDWRPMLESMLEGILQDAGCEGGARERYTAAERLPSFIGSNQSVNQRLPSFIESSCTTKVEYEAWVDSFVQGNRDADQLKEPSGTLATSPMHIDCIMLDGLYLTGELSATHGWRGPLEQGAHKALGVGLSSAYALTPDAAAWLLKRREEQPHHNAEAYLTMLQEERGRSWTHFPRLAIQRWDEVASSVSELSPQAMHAWYAENYFPHCPRCVYGL